MAGYAANLERFDAATGGGARSASRERPARHYGRPRKRPDDAEHRSLARARAAAADRAPGSRRTSTWARAGPLPISARRSLRSSGGPGARHELSRAIVGPPEASTTDDRLSSIREALEQRERETLAPQAARSAASRGRLHPEAEDDVRPAFQHDRDRIIHSKAFRRLKHKTQVFFAPAGDHYRTRLTHTLEVSQIARTIAKVLRLHEELTEVDRARPRPRPHAVRPRRREGAGLAGARRLPSLRAEPAHRRRARERRPRPEPDVGSARRHRPPLEGQEGLAGRSRSRTSAPRRSKGQIMRVADLIAYVNHDIDDAVRAGVLKESDLPRDAVAVLGRLVLGAHRPDGQGRRHRDPGRRSRPRFA